MRKRDRHVADIPSPETLKMLTNDQLAELIAKGNTELKDHLTAEIAKIVVKICKVESDLANLTRRYEDLEYQMNVLAQEKAKKKYLVHGIPVDKFRKTFMTTEILKYIKLRDRYFKLSKTFHDSVTFKEQYKLNRNMVVKLIKKVLKSYHEKALSNCTNLRKTWVTINAHLKNIDPIGIIFSPQNTQQDLDSMTYSAVAFINLIFYQTI